MTIIGAGLVMLAKGDSFANKRYYHVTTREKYGTFSFNTKTLLFGVIKRK